MRALRWQPIAGTAVVAVVAAVAASLFGSPAGGTAVQAALVLCASSLAFAADDLVGQVLPAAPAGPGRRLARRLAAAIPVVGGGVLLIGVLAGRAGLPLPSWSSCAALAVVALAGGVAVDRATDLASPGAAGAGGAVLLAAVVSLVPPPERFVLSASAGAAATLVGLLATTTIVVALRGRR